MPIEKNHYFAILEKSFRAELWKNRPELYPGF